MTHKYETVAAGIRGTIAASLAPHDAVPPERELVAIYGVSRMTVRQAIAKLVDEGRVYNIHGSGTYVGSADLFLKSLKLTSFTEDMMSRGYAASSRVLMLTSEPANAEIARLLNIPIEHECTHIRRLHLADDNPMAIEDDYLAREVLALENFNLAEPLYSQLDRSGHELHRAEQEIQAITLDDEQARLLGVQPGTAALSVTRVSSSRRGQLIEYARTIYRADRYTFQLAVTRESDK